MFDFLKIPPPLTPRERMLKQLSEGVPPELVARAHGLTMDQLQADPDFDRTSAEGEIALFERARDSGVTGAVRAAMRNEAKTWQPKAETMPGQSLEDLLRG